MAPEPTTDSSNEPDLAQEETTMAINLCESFRVMFYTPFYLPFALGTYEAEGVDVTLSTKPESRHGCGATTRRNCRCVLGRSNADYGNAGPDPRAGNYRLQ